MAFLLNMVKRLAQGIALVLAAVFLYFAYSFYTTTYHYNYKLTLVVEADGKVHSGSSIISVTVYDNRKALWTHPGWKSVAWGGSPWVDLGEHGVMLVSSKPTFYQVPDGAHRPLGVAGFALAAFWGAKLPIVDLVSEKNLTQIVKIKERGEVSLDLAQLIWMPDPNRPRSAEFYPPNDQAELETRGIQVRGLFVEMTNERADYSATYDKFPWLKGMQESSPVVHQLPNGLNARTLLGDY